MNFSQPSRGRTDQSCSVFIGNLGDLDNRGAQDCLQSMGLNPVNVRVMMDDTGRPKGAAFVDFKDSSDYEAALKFDGMSAPGQQRRLRINPAAQRPSGR